MKRISAIFLILLCVYLAISVSESTVTVSAYHSGGQVCLDLDQSLELSTNLMRFGTTNGSYYYNGASTNVISNGPTGYLYSSKTGQNHNSSLTAESFGIMQAFDTAGLQTDNTNSPATPCDTGNLAVGNTTGNNSTAGKFPQSASAEIQTGMVAFQSIETPSRYTSNVDFTDSSVQVSHDAAAEQGYNFENLIGSIAAGHNRNSKTLQFSESTHYHVVGNSNDSAPLAAGSLIKFNTDTYGGPDMPVGWEIEETNATPANETAVNNTTVEGALS